MCRPWRYRGIARLPASGRAWGCPPGTGLVSALGATDAYGGVYQQSPPIANRHSLPGGSRPSKPLREGLITPFAQASFRELGAGGGWPDHMRRRQRQMARPAPTPHPYVVLRWPAPRWRSPPSSSRPADVFSTQLTGASIAPHDAGRTVEAFACVCATRSTWTPSRSNCSRWPDHAAEPGLAVASASADGSSGAPGSEARSTPWPSKRNLHLRPVLARRLDCQNTSATCH
jgi:hypothetical protein